MCHPPVAVVWYRLRQAGARRVQLGRLTPAPVAPSAPSHLSFVFFSVRGEIHNGFDENQQGESWPGIM